MSIGLVCQLQVAALNKKENSCYDASSDSKQMTENSHIKRNTADLRNLATLNLTTE